MEVQLQPKTAKRKFYNWHRVIGLISLVPVIFWTVSGLSHPFMSNWFRPFIPQEVFKPLSQQQMAPKLSLQQIMDKNQVAEIRNFSLVHFAKGTYYQLLKRDSSYSYYSATDGSILPNGDQQYAIYLARYFTQDSVSAIKSTVLQKSYDDNYAPINRLLPVWKISLKRADGMDVYIETSQSRLGTFNNNTRKTFLWIFRQFHNWQFLGDLAGETFRIVVLLIIVSFMLLSLLSGIIVYGLFWNRFKQIRQKQEANGRHNNRFLHRFHRQLGLIVSFVMLCFVISGGFHLWVKLQNQGAAQKPFEQLINRSDLGASNLNLVVADSLIKRISIIKFDGLAYYQVLNNKKEYLYINAVNGSILDGGENKFAQYLAGYFGNKSHQYHKLLPNTEPVKQFTEEYGFINKRLPVVKVSYPYNEDWYIETSSAKLATKVAGIDRTEGFSFIFLHKYFGMTWAGKNIRDIVSMLAAAGVLVVSLFGFAAFLKNK
ncbi:PepSY domain-containing protein [Mucilaginibacter sp. PAMB04274]|uniref:PepSY domain-containing protein n=1 Tax=Mucilaginibacter sp. PAMB04274 TaxID=3138568 RepID=UPI0031F70060